MDGRQAFEDIINTFRRKRQLHEEPVVHDIHDIDDGVFFSYLLLINWYYKLYALWL
jgi:hypothetical protein